MSDKTKRWLISYTLYLFIGAIAVGIVYWAGLPAYSFPILIIFLLGYLAGRITKGIER